MDIMGLDLGTTQIKYVSIKKETKTLIGFGSAPAPKVSLDSENPADVESYINYLKEYFNSQSNIPSLVSVGLPEYKVFNRIINVPKMSDKELKTAIPLEAEQYLPIPIKDVVYDYRVVEETDSGKKQNVILIAAPRELVKKYAGIIAKAGFTLVGLEPETAAITRCTIDLTSSPMATLIVNIGAASTDMALVYGGVVRFTRSIGTGGNALSRAIAQELGFESSQAEEYKKAYGLDESQLEGKVMKAIRPVFETIVDEIRRALAYYQTHQTQSPILKRLVLCGGTASLPGVLVYLASALNLEAQLANPWVQIKNSDKFSEKELEAIGPTFAVAAGLALKEF